MNCITDQIERNPRGAASQILAALRARGSSVSAWAREHQYPASSVYSAIKTWAGRTDRPPLGGISSQIMADLQDELGSDVVRTPRRTAS